MTEKPWGGKFTQETNAFAEEFTSSFSFDKRLFHYDIKGSIAYCKALARAGILSQQDKKKILHALKEIEGEIERGEFPFSPRWEDIHMHIEQRLLEKIGEVGGKLHTGRSRNDQISLDMRLYLKEEGTSILTLLKELQNSLVSQAAQYMSVIMPGYTHFRKAQPILFSHHLMAYYEMFKRDRERLTDALHRINVLPLGSSALAGTPYPIDRRYLAKLLGFAEISQNSIDAVSDRDFVVEFIFHGALIMMHLSRLSEDFIIWSSPEFGFLHLPQSFCTGSSIMPQKENPDVLELIRAKTGRIYGALVSLLTILKALPMAYNRDLQEDKEPLFDAVDTLKSSLRIMIKLLGGIEVHQERMKKAAEEGFINATEVADYLVKRGMPFRKAHQIVGKVVKYAEEMRKRLEDLTLDEFQSFSPAIAADIVDYIRIEGSVDHRHNIGGTAPQMVAEQIKRAQKELAR
jgi:argininosuccinate lyase